MRPSLSSQNRIGIASDESGRFAHTESSDCRLFVVAGIIVVALFIVRSELFASAARAEDWGVAPGVRVPLTLVLKAKAMVVDEQVTLSDIALCQGFARLCSVADQLVLQASPAPGRRATLAQAVLREKLSRQWPFVDFDLRGPKLVIVEAKSFAVEVERVRQAIRDWLIKRSNENQRLSLVDVYPPAFMRTRRPLDQAITVAAVKQSIVHGMNELVVKADKQQWTLRAHIKKELRVLVARDDLARGSVLSAGLVEEAWQRVRSQHEAELIGPSSLEAGLMTRQAISKGRILLDGMFRRPFVVRRKQRVNLQVSDGGLVVSRKAEAMNDGGMGDVISLRLAGSRERIQGRITANGEVVPL